MTSKPAYTAADAADIARKLGDALDMAQQSLPAWRLERIRRLQQKIDSLSRRGLLNRQPAPAAFPADFPRRHRVKWACGCVIN